MTTLPTGLHGSASRRTAWSTTRTFQYRDSPIDTSEFLFELFYDSLNVHVVLSLCDGPKLCDVREVLQPLVLSL